MENVIKTPSPDNLPMESVQPCTLMGLPIEVRSKILGHLLPSALEIGVSEHFSWGVEHERDRVFYRPQDEACHMAVLRVNRQLSGEGSSILHNRTFRVLVTYRGVSFLERRYELGDISKPMLHGDYELRANPLLAFPFHRVKQIQIGLWATDFRYNLFALRRALIDLCDVLNHQPSLKNIRIDMYDRFYRPNIPESPDEIAFEDDAPHPPPSRNRANIDYFFYDCQKEFWYSMFEKPWADPLGHTPPDRAFGLWERGNDTPRITHDIPALITDVELILQPLKSLRNVGKARFNLTSKAEKDQDMMSIVKECEDAMMSGGSSEEDSEFMDWCSDPSLPWGLEKLFSEEQV